MGIFAPFSFLEKNEPFTPAPYQFRSDAYSSFLNLAIPGAVFTDLGMSNYYDDVHADIAGAGTNFVANPTGSAAEFSADGANIKWPTEDYASSLRLYDNGCWGTIPDTDIAIGPNEAFVVEGWIRMSERFTKPPYWKVAMRQNNYNLSVEFGFPASGTTDMKARLMINNNQYFSSNQQITYNLNQWYHIAWVRYVGGAMAMYFNGTKYAISGTQTAAPITGGFIRIMNGENATNDGTNGAWQDFRMYIGTDKGYTASTITTPNSMIEKI